MWRINYPIQVSKNFYRNVGIISELLIRKIVNNLSIGTLYDTLSSEKEQGLKPNQTWLVTRKITLYKMYVILRV